MKSAKLAYWIKNPHYALWHPHQGLWNFYTDRAFGWFPVSYIIVLLDTAARITLATFRRAKRLGLLSLFQGSDFQSRNAREQGIKVVFIDLGLHVSANQTIKFVQWFGMALDLFVLAYEANPVYCEQAETHYYSADIDRKARSRTRVDFRNFALVGPDNRSKYVKLYSAVGSGRGDSVFRERGKQSINVSARRLSNDMKEMGIDVTSDVVILRMNIEGSELFVIKDLIDSGIIQYIDGFYGMWDDLFKIDPEKDKELIRLMHSYDIHPFTFNDRDLARGSKYQRLVWRAREWAIRYDLFTSISAGYKRKASRP